MNIHRISGFSIGLALCISAILCDVSAQTNQARTGRFTRGTGTNATLQSFVIPLDYQYGVPLDNIGGNVTNLFPVNTWTTTLYHYNALQPQSSTNNSFRIPYQNPIVAFGHRVGGSSLYTGQDYHWGMYSGCNQYAGLSVIYVYALNRTNSATISYTNIYIPQENEASLWNIFATNGYSKTVNLLGLSTTVGRLSDARWGSDYTHSYLLTHQASDQATNYIFYVICVGYTTGSWMSTDANQYGDWTRMYTAEFEKRPLWQPIFLDQTHFEGQPLPSFYYDKSVEELQTVTATIPQITFSAQTNYLRLDHSPELRRHPILDKFVSDMGNDPIALANYVGNQVEVTDAMDYDTNHNNSAALYLNGLNRSALAVFQEGQGSPTEQCALLIYLLRQANIPATFVFPTNNGLQMLDIQVSKMLGIQLSKALLADGTTNNLPHLVPLNYPWVAAYINTNWVHIFPWIKDIELVEGLNLYDHMPTNYNNGYKWMLKYLEKDTNIMSLSTESDQPSVVFPAFIEKSLRDNYRGVSIDDLGMKRVQRRNYYARWEDFPRPFSLTGSPTVKESYQNNLEWFNTVQIRVSSANNTNLYVDSGELRVADIHNRRLLLRFEQVGGVNTHRMILSLAPYYSAITNKGTFGDNPTYALSASNTLQSSDDYLRYQVICRRLKCLGTNYLAPDYTTNYYEYLYDQASQTQLGINYNETEKPFRKGDMIAFCLDTGRVTEKMLRVHAEDLWQFERTSPGTAPTARDLEIYQGTTTYLMGMSYWQSRDRFTQWNQDIHKIKTIGNFAYGFSLLKPKRDSSGNLVTNGMIIPIQPHIHMPVTATITIYNGTSRADSGQDYESAHWDYRLIDGVQGSAAEHGIIESFFHTNAVSSVRLLHLAGSANILRLNFNNYLSYRTQIESADSSMWKSVSNWFTTGYLSEYCSQAFVTPGAIVNGTYSGVGSFMIQPYGFAALITGVMNGGAGSSLPDTAFSGNNADKWRLESSPEGSETAYSISQTGVNSDNAYAFQVSQYQERSTYDSIPSLWSDPQATATGSRVNYLFGASSSDMQAAFINSDNSGLFDTHTSYQGDFLSLVADPVNTITGEHYVDVADLRLNGPMPLEIRRNYSSLNLMASQFGYGWKISFMPNLTIITNGLIFAAEPNGSVIAYTPTSTNASYWRPTTANNPLLNNTTPSGVNSLANPLNAYIKQDLISGTNVYQLFLPDGSIRRYEMRPFQTDSLFSHQRPYLVKWQDNRSNYFTFVYQDDVTLPGYGEVRRVQSSNGDYLVFYYDVCGRIVEAFTGDGRHIFYEYDGEGDLTKIILPDASEISYDYRHDSYLTNGGTHYYSTHLIQTENKPDGRRIENVYDSKRRVVAQMATVDVDLNICTNAVFTYSNNFNTVNPDSPVSGYTLVVDVFGNVSRYDYTNSLLTKITDALNQTIEQDWYWTNDSSGGFAHSLKYRKDKRGLRTEYKYDLQGNATNVTQRGDLTGNGSTNETFVTLSVFSNTLPMQVSNSVGIVTKYIYADTNYPFLPTRIESYSSNTLVSVTRNTYYTTNASGCYTYGLLGESIRAFESSDAATNSYLYNGHGLLTQLTRRTGNTDSDVVMNYSYNNRGELIEQTDTAGRKTRNGYDSMGRPIQREIYESGQTQPADWEYSYYNENGEMTWSDGSRFDPEDYVWRDYDSAGRKIVEIRWRSQAKQDGTGVEAVPGNGLYSTTWFEYDRFGNQKRIITPRGVITTNTWNSLGQLVSRMILETNGSVLTLESFGYEKGGLIAFHTNALGAYTEQQYTSTGQIKYQKNLDGSTNVWRYYADGRVYQEIMANGNYWESTYDDANRRMTRKFKKSSLLLATTISEFDRRGNTVQQTDEAGNVFTNYYDGLDRLKTSAGSQVTSVTMNQDLTFTTNVSRHITAYNYDSCGKVLTITNAIGEKVITTSDALGRPVAVEVKDAQNNLVRITSTSYAANHHSASITNGSGANAIVSTTYTDTFGNPVLSINYPSTSAKEFTLNNYDNVGNRIYQGRYSNTNNVTTLWTANSWAYDGLNRIRTETIKDGAVTTFSYDSLGNLTNRAMPDGLNAITSFDNAGRILTEKDNSGGQDTRKLTYTYYSGGQWQGKMWTVTDDRGVIRTNIYDRMLRLAGVDATGPLNEQKMSLAWQYDVRGLLTNITQSFASTDTGPTTIVRRDYDSYGAVIAEVSTLGNLPQSSANQTWSSTGRRSQVSFGNWIANFAHRADGQMIAANDAIFGYADSGLLTGRTNSFRSYTITSRDGLGRPKQTVTKVVTTTKFTETLSWRGDGLLTNYSGDRTGAFTDSRLFQYSDYAQRLTKETYALGSSLSATNTYIYDLGQPSKLGVMTSADQSGSLFGTWSAASGDLDGFKRVKGEQNSIIHRTARGQVNGPATLRGNVNGRSIDIQYSPTVGGDWSAETTLFPGTNVLAVYADHPSGKFTTNKVSSFTVNSGSLDKLDTLFDATGNVTNRVWKKANGTVVKSQSLVWDPMGRLIKVTERDGGNNGYNWQANFDGLGRRVQTLVTPVTNSMVLNAQLSTINHYYDPQVEFLEVGVSINGKYTWKLYGPDVDGKYGSQQGLGGLESLYGVTGSGIIQDYFGNILGSIANTSVSWSSNRVSTYGPVEGFAPPALLLSLTADNLSWRGKWHDVTDFYYWGARPYDFERRSFLSFDPSGHSATPDGYAAFNNNPGFYWDSDGRLGKQWTDRSQEYQGNVHSVGDFVSAVGYGVGGTILRVPGDIGLTFDRASAGMGEARQEISTYTGAQAFMARSLELPADFAFGTIRLVNDPINTVPRIPEGFINLVNKTLNDPGQFINEPSINNGFNILEDAIAWYGIGKTVQNVSGNVSTPGNSPGSVIVSRWGSQGLNPGNWVMNGPASYWNYLRSFKWQPGGGNQYAPPGSGQVFSVPANTVQWPSGWGIDGAWKGLFGQRQYIP